jgi:hypothetical protein
VPGADFEETLTSSLTAAVWFPVGGGTRVRLGATHRTHLEDASTIVPDFGVDGIGSGAWRVEWRGHALRASREVWPCLRLGAGVRYLHDDARLADSDRVPGGVFRDVRLGVGAFAAWTPNDRLTVSLTVWHDVDHWVRIDDRDGERVTSFDGDGSLAIALGLTWEL